MGRHVARGLTWTLVQTWGGQALSLLVFILLARLLTPEDFGLVALAAVFVALAQLVVDQGLGDALIQRREITPGQVDTAFWVAVATGAVLTLLGLLLAAPLSAVLHEPDLAPLLQVLSLTFLLAAFSSIPIALLSRRLAFRILAIRAILSIVAGGIVGIAMAYAHFGAWALVGQQVAAAVVSVTLLWTATAWRPRLHAGRGEFAELFAFGARVVGSDILGYITRNADNFLIGAFLGTIPLGIYAIGYRILDTSQRLLINVARKIAFPAFARLQHEPARLTHAYLRVSRTANVLILPAYVGLALVAPELILVVFGTKWAESGPVASLLFLSGPVLGVQAFSGAILYAAGHPEVVLRFRIVSTAVTVVAFVVALPFGIVAVAGAFTLRAYLFLPLLLAWTQRFAGVRTRDYLGELRSVALITAGMAAAVALVKVALPPTVAPLARLVVEVVAGGVVFSLLLWVIDRRLLREMWRLLTHAVPGVGALNRRLGVRDGDETVAPGGQP